MYKGTAVITGAANGIGQAYARRLAADGIAVADVVNAAATRASVLAEGKADATVFGSAFLANPDLPERFRVGAALNAPHRNTFFAPPTAQGYIDFPTLSVAETA